MLWALAALLCLSACSRGTDQHAAMEAVPVLVAKAQRKTVATTLKAIGTVEAYSTVDVKAQVTGEVIAVHFKEGEEVRKGDVLFTIDPRPFEAALQQAEANLAKDHALELQSTADERRYSALLKERVGSQQQYDVAHATAESARASVAADQAAVQTARLNLEYATITSPIDGRVGNLLLHAGNIVKADDTTAMVVINQIHPIYVDFSVPEQSLPEVQRYMQEQKLEVDVTIPGPQRNTEHGALSFVDNSVNSQTGTIELKGVFANQDGRLWPGQFVDATLTLNERPDTITVPSEAIQTGVDGSYVFVIDGDMKAGIRPVVIGDTAQGETVIEHGLSAGETVVTDGQLRLIPGAPVTIKSRVGTTNGFTS